MTTIDGIFLSPGSADLRLSDADRNAAVAALERERAAGRLTDDELSERRVLARAARTRGDLLPCFADLPESQAVPPLASATGAAGPRSGARTAAWLIMSLSPFVAVLLFFGTGFAFGGWAWSWLWFLLIPVAGIVGVALRGGPRR